MKLRFADAAFSEGILSRLPYSLSGSVQKTYLEQYAVDHAQANRYLLGVSDLLEGKSLLVHSDSALRLKAERLADQCMVNDVDRAAAYLESVGLSLPAGDSNASVIARVKCPIWWERALRRKQDREQEHLSIQLGLVRKGLQVYVSTDLLNRMWARHQRSLEIMAGRELVEIETGEALPLLDVIKGSMANPAVRRAELMVRMRGFENYATEQGHAAAFYTLTCPSKYHRYSGRVYNPNYNQSTPKEAQGYLRGIWAKIRAKLKNAGMNVYGFRIAEPHHDGCPHWHLLMFMLPEHVEAVNGILRRYAMAEAGDEPGAEKHRFTVKMIDQSKGSATGYIAKYVSKNIDGFNLDMDNEAALPADDAAARVRAWASTWGIRQFQQIGGAPVGVWRELRRVKHAEHALLEQARAAADVGDWCGYLNAQGGAACNRAAQPIRVYSLEAVDVETGEVLQNRYGEFVGRVAGLAVDGIRAIETRLKQWTIRDKGSAAAVTLADLKPEVTFDLLESVRATFDHAPYWNSLDAESGSSLPWSPVNNCTEWENEARQEWRRIQKDPDRDKWARERYHAEADYVAAAMCLVDKPVISGAGWANEAREARLERVYIQMESMGVGA